MNPFFRPSRIDGRPVLDMEKVKAAVICAVVGHAWHWVRTSRKAKADRSFIGKIKILLWLEWAVLTGLLIGVVVWRLWRGGAS